MICDHCNQSFEEILSFSAHKAHCPKEKVAYNLTEEGRRNRGWSRGRTKFNDERLLRMSLKYRKPEELVFVENSKHVKAAMNRIREELPEVCSICKLGNIWNGALLVLRIDHINGDNQDCRRENFRKVCPNCDSQLETYGARNKKRVKMLRLMRSEK